MCQILVYIKRLAIFFSSYLILLFLSDHLFFSYIYYVNALFLSGNIMSNVVIYLPTGWQFFLSIFIQCNAFLYSLLVIWSNNNTINDLFFFYWVIFFFLHFAITQYFLPLRYFFCHYTIKYISYDNIFDF